MKQYDEDEKNPEEEEDIDLNEEDMEDMVEHEDKHDMARRLIMELRATGLEEAEENGCDVKTPEDVISKCHEIAEAYGVDWKHTGIVEDKENGAFGMNRAAVFTKGNEKGAESIMEITKYLMTEIFNDETNKFGGYGDSAARPILQILVRAVLDGQFDSLYPELEDPGLKAGVVSIINVMFEDKHNESADKGHLLALNATMNSFILKIQESIETLNLAILSTDNYWTEHSDPNEFFSSVSFLDSVLEMMGDMGGKVGGATAEQAKMSTDMARNHIRNLCNNSINKLMKSSAMRGKSAESLIEEMKRRLQDDDDEEQNDDGEE